MVTQMELRPLIHRRLVETQRIFLQYVSSFNYKYIKTGIVNRGIRWPVNKNFVIKNGIEVADDLIFANSTLDKVGIGSTLPSTTLDIKGQGMRRRGR